MREMFGHTTFRKHQESVLRETLAGRDALVVMATGAGKSMCFQLAPLVSGRTLRPTLVVTPLISLGVDQTLALQLAGVPCAFVSSSTTTAAGARDVWADAEAGRLALIYVCPETLLSARERVLRVHHAVGFTSIAVDEV